MARHSDHYVSPRDRLVDAAWRTIDELPLAPALGHMTSAEVARNAGVTTGSLFHHFDDMAGLCDAMVMRLRSDEAPQGEPIEDLMAALVDVDLLQLVTDATRDRWVRHRSEPVRHVGFRHEMLAFASNHRPLGSPLEGMTTVNDVLAERVRSRQDEIARVWEAVFRAVGRTVVEPFTLDRLTTGITAIFYGLAIRHAVEPDAVDDDLLPDLVGTLVVALSKPLGSDRRMPDLVASLGTDRPLLHETARSPQARTGARRRAETRTRIVQAAVGMFAHGWEGVQTSDIAERADVSVQTVLNIFGDSRAVAAATFGVHAADIVGDPGDPGDGDGDDIARLEAMLRRLAASASADPEPANALLHARLADRRPTGARGEPFGARSDLPLGRAVAEPLHAARADIDAGSWAERLVDVVLLGATTTADEPAELARMALRMLPPVRST